MRALLGVGRMRFLIVALLTATVGLASAAPAQGYRRLSNLLVSSPDGGTLDVCRDGIRFQVFSSTPEGEAPGPPGVEVDYAAYSPAPPLDENGIPIVDPSTPIVAADRLTLERQSTPFDAVPGDGQVEWDLVTRTTRWDGGLLPEGASVYLEIPFAASNVPYYTVEDCFLFPRNNVACGDTITRDTTLQADLACPRGTRALTIGADRITLDLAGHSITGGEVVLKGHERVTIRDGGIEDLLLRDADRNRLLFLEISGEGGLELVDSNRNAIVANTIETTPLGNGSALILTSSDRNAIWGNDITGIAEAGGLTMGGGSDRNIVIDNDIRGSQADGLDLLQGSRNDIVGNRARASGGGGVDPRAIVVLAGGRNLVRNNDATTDNADIGGDDAIFIAAAAERTVLEGNTAHDSGDDGIDVESRSTTLERNAANDNGDLGIEAVAGVRDAGGNSASGNGNPSQCVGVSCD